RPLALLLLAVTPGCYAAMRASHDINASWEGRTRAELEDAWGPPAAAQEQPGGASLRYTHVHTGIDLPSVRKTEVDVVPGLLTAHTVEVNPGAIYHDAYDVDVLVDSSGHIAQMQGASSFWRAPSDANV